MTTPVKPLVTTDEVQDVLYRSLRAKPKRINEPATGVISSTYECIIDDGTVVVRFSRPNMSRTLLVERMFGESLRSAGVPLRKLLANGKHRGLVYSVAKKVPGVGLMTLPPSGFRRALSSVFDTLIAMSRIDLAGTSGFGYIGTGIDAGTVGRSRPCDVQVRS